MHRRTIFSLFGVGFLEALLRAFFPATRARTDGRWILLGPRGPRRLTFTTAGALPPMRVAIITGTDLDGNPVSEEIPYLDDGQEMVSALRYREFSIVVPARLERVPISIGYSAG